MEEHKNHVHIVSWPKEPAKLEHQFKKDSPANVEIKFDKEPANVVIQNGPKNPMNVDMDMFLKVKEPVPVCISLCEPICAKSDYTVSLNFLDRHVGSISIKGMTKLFNCFENERPKPLCVDFREFKEGTVFKDSLTHYGLIFTPVENHLYIISGGDPQGVNKLRFSDEGIKIVFPYPIDKAQLKMLSQAGNVIHIEIFDQSGLLKTIDEAIGDVAETIEIDQENMTTIIVSGGSGEAALIEACYIAF